MKATLPRVGLSEMLGRLRGTACHPHVSKPFLSGGSNARINAPPHTTYMKDRLKGGRVE